MITLDMSTNFNLIFSTGLLKKIELSLFIFQINNAGNNKRSEISYEAKHKP